jgi:hypothetical protein
MTDWTYEDGWARSPAGQVDTVPPMQGHWTLDVHDGDVERRPLTPEQVRENALFAELHPDAPFPLHVGAIVSRPIDTYEGDNLVLTSGKGLLLDRLFGITATQVNSMGVGATATGAVVGDTQLGSTPTILAFDALPIRAALVVTCITTFGTGSANISWNELGMFNGTVNGTSTMFNHIAPIGPFAKTSAVSIVVTVTVTQS